MAGLLYKKDPKITSSRITAQSDSTWADHLHGSNSTSGFIIQLNMRSLIHWGTRIQKSVKTPATPPATSSAEAEYVAASGACKQIQWFSSIMTELRIMQKGPDVQPPLLGLDSQAALKIAQSQGFLERTKHIRIAFHNVRAHYQNGDIEMQYVQSDLNTADVMTKPLKKIAFGRHIFGDEGFNHDGALQATS